MEILPTFLIRGSSWDTYVREENCDFEWCANTFSIFHLFLKNSTQIRRLLGSLKIFANLNFHLFFLTAKNETAGYTLLICRLNANSLKSLSKFYAFSVTSVFWNSD